MRLKDYNEYEGTTLELSKEVYRKTFGVYANGFFVMEDDVDNSKGYLGKPATRKVKKQMREKQKHVWPGMEVD